MFLFLFFSWVFDLRNSNVFVVEEIMKVYGVSASGEVAAGDKTFGLINKILWIFYAIDIFFLN